jgi:F-type H+-transporting ATPase subunit delta
MIERTLAKRYAAALLKVTDPEGSTEETEALLLALKDAYRKDKGLRALLSHPSVPRSAKKSLLHRAFEGKCARSFLEFLDLLVRKNRLELIPDISDLYDRLADASHGIVRVQVRSWRPLSEAHRQKLQEGLGRMVGKKVLLEAQADPALKGGMLVHIGDTVIDGSVAHHLKVLGEQFRMLERA